MVKFNKKRDDEEETLRLKLKVEKFPYVVLPPPEWRPHISGGILLCGGYFEWWTGTIRINAKLNLIFKVLVVLHELGHVIFYFLGTHPLQQNSIHDVWNKLWKPLERITIRYRTNLPSRPIFSNIPSR